MHLRIYKLGACFHKTNLSSEKSQSSRKGLEEFEESVPSNLSLADGVVCPCLFLRPRRSSSKLVCSLETPLVLRSNSFKKSNIVLHNHGRGRQACVSSS